MAFFENKQNTLTESERLQQKINTARYSMLLVALLTAVNAIILLAGSDTYFLFSAALPYHLVILANEIVVQGGSSVLLVLSICFLFVVVAAYVVCFVFGNKHIAWLIASLSMFVIDTIYYIFIFVTLYLPILAAGGTSVISTLIEALFHAYALYYFVIAVVNAFKLKKLNAAEASAQPISGDNGTANLSEPDEQAEEASYSSDDNKF